MPTPTFDGGFLILFNFMKTERNGFIFLKTFDESIEDLETQDKCIMYEAIVKYGLYGIEPQFSKGYLKSIWKLITSTIDATSKKYDASVENGKKGGRPKKEPNNNPTETQEKPNNNPIETLKEKKIELNKIKEKENKIEIKENNIKELDFGRFNDL
jgi:hypothetical protein